ncbi:MAG: T9SS type B sorting domain-containing protein [Paludibacteraceae bacterium]|nr:T9SS type B sorting domain-containing protein [Paludibacteraceae bacterium]
MYRRARTIFLFFLFLLLGVTVTFAQECPDGTLLFREDFGGNSPDDLPVSVNPSPGMSPSYQQITSPNMGFSSGRYMLTKNGGKNGNQWYWQDDHTYPDDYERGYLLLVDGSGGEHQFFEVVMDGLCSGVPMYFSAWVVNVHTVEHERVWGLNRIIRPNLTFAIYDGETGVLIDSYDTGPIHPDASLPLGDDYKKSSQWNKYGIRFSLPEGTHSARMKIVNHASYGVGNDFAMDDIEVRICNEKPELTPPAEICMNRDVKLHAYFDNTLGETENLRYRWLFSSTGEVKTNSDWRILADTEVPDYTIAGFTVADNGYYRVAVANEQNIDREYCRGMSDPLLLQGEVCPCLEVLRDTVFLTSCDSLLYGGAVYRESGSFPLDTLQTMAGCDSVNILSISLLHSVLTQFDIQLCEGDSYRFDDEDLNVSGVYSREYRARNGCDSVAVLNLQMNVCQEPCEDVERIIYENVCVGKAYDGYGFTLPIQEVTGEFTYRNEVRKGDCDSVTLLRLTVQNCEKEHARPCGGGAGDISPAVYFTPNGDGVHDRWQIENIGCFEHEVHIFDRFGKELCSWKNNFDGWDGTYLGKPMPSTDYWYWIKLLPHGKIHTGHFTLAR